MQNLTDADVDERAATCGFDPRRHRRITGLLDIWMEPGRRGGLVLPMNSHRPADPRAIVDLVRRSGETANDVRILTNDGARHYELFSEVAGLLAHDVLVSPEGAEIRHRTRRGWNGPMHAIPCDRATRRTMDWIVIQPPDLATPLPGWFTVDRGLVSPRKGVVSLPLPDGLVLASRADFVSRRALAHRLGATSEGLVTVAVTARAGGFLVGEYGGTQRVYSGGQLAALLGDLPLYGCNLRLWLTWPSDPDEQHSLAIQAQELAATTGATVWTAPPGGSAELIDGQHDLRARDDAGEPAEWRAYRPRFAAGSPTLRTTPDGLLVPALARSIVTVRTAPPRDGERPEADQPPHAEPLPPAVPAVVAPLPIQEEAADPTPRPAPEQAAFPAALPRPALSTEDRHAPAYGPAWLPPGQVVNAEQFEAFIVSPVAAESVADGVPSAELFLLALLSAKSLPEGTRLVRVRVGPGGAIPLTALRARVPARLQHLTGIRDAYLLPAARLGRVFALGTLRVDRPGHVVRDGECDGRSLRIRCSYPARSIAGLPNEVRRWPATRQRRAYALLPAGCTRLPSGWLRLYHRRPPVRAGRLMLELQVPRERAIDVTLTAEGLAHLTRVRTRADGLRAARVELILGSRSYGRVTVRRAYRADGGEWRRVPQVDSGPLPDFLARLQASTPA